MKRSLITALLLATCPLLASGSLNYPDAAEVQATAQAEHKPMLIFWHGSDWMQHSDDYYKEWNTLKDMGLPVILSQFDEKTGVGADAYKKVLPYRAYNLPVVLLLTEEGTPVATFTGKAIRSADKLKAAVTQKLAIVPQFTDLVTRGKQAKGVEGARLLGQALDLLDEQDTANCGALIQQIRNKDPKDETGYILRYGTDHMAMFKQINKLLTDEGKRKGADRNFEAANQYVDQVLARDHLTTAIKQQWTAGKAYIMSERLKSNDQLSDTKARKELAGLYRSITQMDPKSEYGKGASTYAHYWDPDTFFTIKNGFYSSKHQTRNFEKDWHIDIKDQLTKPGLYRFTLEPTLNGKLVTRNFRLVINGKEVGKAEDAAADTDTKSVTIRVPKVSRIRKAEVWLTAECRDGWLGCAGSIKMERIGD